MKTPGEIAHHPFAVVFSTTLVLAYASLIALYPAAIAPELAQSLGVTSSAVGLQLSLIFGGAILSSLIGGPLTRRLGPCRTSQLSLTLLGSGALLLSVPTLPSFAIASLVAGLGYGLTNPAASLLLVRFTPSQYRGLIFSIKQTGVPLGGVLAGATAPLIAVTLGWQAGLWLYGALAVVGILLLQPNISHWDDQRTPGTPWLSRPFTGVALVWQHPSLHYVALLSLCFATIQLSISAFTVALLVEDLAFSLVDAGLVMSALQVSGVLGRITWGWLGDWLGNRFLTLLIIAATTALGCMLIASMSVSWPNMMVVIILCLTGFSSLGWNGVFMAEVAQLSPQNRVADAAAGCLVFTYSGVLFGLPLFASLHSWLGNYPSVFGLLSVLALASISFLWLAHSHRHASTP
ncbi:MAG: MFS transporter [Halomonas sp.]|nr:MFS transporter [Halomonas sp.]